MRKLLWLAVTFLSCTGANPAAPGDAGSPELDASVPGVDAGPSTQDFSDGTWRYSDVTITSTDGTRLEAGLWVPNATRAGATFPAIVFVNSWTLNAQEYKAQAEQFAAAGYVVLSYSTRGFGKSEGVLNVAGSKDIADVGAVIDWLLINAPVRADSIGMSGISYGAGISLLSAGLEPRVKVVVAMSGFTDIDRALNGNGTPRLVWGSILIGSGTVTGKMDPQVMTLFNDVLAHQNLADWRAFAAERSAINVIDRINAAHKPIYISNNLQDELFQPNPLVDFFNGLTGPRRLDLNRGEHATAEASGLLGATDNYVWVKAHAWFDHYLKHLDNGIDREPELVVQQKFTDERVSYPSWPASNISPRTLFLTPGLLNHGTLDVVQATSPSAISFLSGVDTVATTGVPVASAVLEGHTPLEVIASMPAVNGANAATWVSDAQSSVLKLRGSATVHARLSASAGDVTVVAYLYDVDALRAGKLISHGVATIRGADASHPTDLALDLNFIAYDVAVGHSIGLVIDTVDALYESTAGISVVELAPVANTLSLPVEN